MSIKNTLLKLVHGRPVFKETKEKITLFPVEHQIKSFFELPNVLRSTLDYMKDLDQPSSKVTNFVQGKLWKKIKQNYPAETIMIPIMLYSDDFNPDNALSGGAPNKQCSFQYTFPVLPQHLLSSTEFVFEALLFPSKIKSLENGLRDCLTDLVDVFKKLEEKGIMLNLRDEQINVIFVMCLKLGDNLDLNEMLGF